MNRELTKRIFTSILLAAIVLGCLFINNYFWLLLLIIVSLICWLEFINISKKIWRKDTPKIVAGFLSFCFLFIFIYSAYQLKTQGLGSEIKIIFILLVCILSDIGGYVVGKTIGGRKLTKISPNKTVSGSIGSFIFSLFPIGVFFALTKIIQEDLFQFINYDYLILFCLVLSLTGQLGDLIISYFKRLAKVKDTGNILPGHGGMLDRIDGIIFVIPVAFIFNFV